MKQQKSREVRNRDRQRETAKLAHELKQQNEKEKKMCTRKLKIRNKHQEAESCTLETSTLQSWISVKYRICGKLCACALRRTRTSEGKTVRMLFIYAGEV